MDAERPALPLLCRSMKSKILAAIAKMEWVEGSFVPRDVPLIPRAFYSQDLPMLDVLTQTLRDATGEVRCCASFAPSRSSLRLYEEPPLCTRRAPPAFFGSAWCPCSLWAVPHSSVLTPCPSAVDMRTLWTASKRSG